MNRSWDTVEPLVYQASNPVTTVSCPTTVNASWDGMASPRPATVTPAVLVGHT